MTGRKVEENSETTQAAAVGVDESGLVTAGSSEMELFRAGHLSREEFIVKSAERATAHLEGLIDPQRLEDMRELLCSQLRNDEALSALITSLATGSR